MDEGRVLPGCLDMCLSIFATHDEQLIPDIFM